MTENFWRIPHALQNESLERWFWRFGHYAMEPKRPAPDFARDALSRISRRRGMAAWFRIVQADRINQAKLHFLADDRRAAKKLESPGLAGWFATESAAGRFRPSLPV